MKTSITSSLLPLFLALAMTDAQGQVATSASGTALPAAATAATLPAPTAWRVVDRGSAHKTWQRETYAWGPDGQVVVQAHTYKELASGMHYKKNGKWLEAQELIEPYSAGAIAQHGQHQAIFGNNLNSAAAITVQMPNGKQLAINPLGLAFYDRSTGNSLWIGQIRDSQGEMISAHQVLYPNAFGGSVTADVRYTYKRGGVEQDIILRTRLADEETPEALGLNPQTTDLEVITEFPGAPKATVQDHSAARHPSLDQDISWGSMFLGHGKAFDLGDRGLDLTAVSVVKRYVTDQQGRTLLLERVRWQDIEKRLAALPAQASMERQNPSVLEAKAGFLHDGTTLHRAGAETGAAHVAARSLVAKTLKLPKTPATRPVNGPMKMASVKPSGQGLVLDYVLLDNTTPSPFTFEGGTTYLIGDGGLNLSDTTTFEGGTCIKYISDPTELQLWGPAVCQATTGRPIIMTSQNDDTVGEPISVGGPLYVLGAFSMCAWGYDVEMEHLRVCYADSGIHPTCETFRLKDTQFVNCYRPVCPEYVDCQLNNILMFNTVNAFWGGQYTVEASHLTLDGCQQFTDGWDDSSDDNITITNSLLINISAFGNAPVATNFTVQLASDAGIFQTAGAGSYYLATNSPYRGCGTTNIDPEWLADIQAKTTYPPVLYANVAFTSATNLGPQAPRDNAGSPGLGYHYDCLDYVLGGCDLYTNLTFSAGTSIGWYEDYGSGDFYGEPYALALNDGAVLTFAGNATQPCLVPLITMVQEGNGNCASYGWMAGFVLNGSGNPPIPQLSAQFTKWTGFPQWSCLRDFGDYGNVGMADSEIWAQGFTSYASSYYLTNCLVWRSTGGCWAGADAASVTCQNCTFFNGGLALCRYDGQSPSFWNIVNTTFDGTAFLTSDNLNGATNSTLFDHNAYNTDNLDWQNFDFGVGIPSAGTLETVGPDDVTVANGYNWQSSWFGDYYLPPGSPLIQQGSATADKLGLYHFTTQTNQAPETNSVVTIGYHYVATDAYGDPLDTNGDGIPDYIEDANGNGRVDSSEIGWNIPGDLGLQVIISRPRNGSSVP